MELKDVLQSFLPQEVVELFDIVKIEDLPEQWQMDISDSQTFCLMRAHQQGLPLDP